MSQNFLKTTTASGLSIEINSGFDRVLGELFVNVNVLSDVPDEDNVSEAIERELQTISLLQSERPDNAAQIAYGLGQLGVKVPQSMLDAIEDDRSANRGNSVRVFNVDGTLQASLGLES